MRRHFPKWLFLLSLLLLGGGYAITAYPVITLKTVNIAGTDRISQENLPLNIGDNIFAINLDRVLNTVLANNFVEAASARIDHKGNLAVTVTEKVPTAYLYLDKLYGVTARGELVPVSLTDTIMSLPVIQGLQVETVQLFKVINDPVLHGALKLIRLMGDRYPRSYANLSEIRGSTAGLHLIFEPGSIVADFGWGDYEKKIARLENILSNNKNPGLDLDLRLVDLAIMKTRVLNREVNNGI